MQNEQYPRTEADEKAEHNADEDWAKHQADKLTIASTVLGEVALPPGEVEPLLAAQNEQADMPDEGQAPPTAA